MFLSWNKNPLVSESTCFFPSGLLPPEMSTWWQTGLIWGQYIRLLLSLTLLWSFVPTGHWGWKPGGNGGRDPTEKAQTQKTSGQRFFKQRWRRLQGQEETRSSSGWETLSEPPKTYQANEYHHWYSHQLQRWVKTFIYIVHWIFLNYLTFDHSFFIFLHCLLETSTWC